MCDILVSGNGFCQNGRNDVSGTIDGGESGIVMKEWRIQDL